MKKALLLALSLLLVLGGTGATARSMQSAALPGLPATVQDFQPDGIDVKSYPTTDFSGEAPVVGSTDWRVVRGTGNAAELWLTASDTGRIYDMGGRYINYTDDSGETWKTVRPPEPLINGEGSVVVAPNGDILGITWDPYAGDRVWSFKYTAATDKWTYMIDPFHTPFWDRPGIDVIPGDFTSPTGEKVSYITLIKGFPHEIWHYSYDGLNYPFTTSKTVDGRTTTPVTDWLDVKPDASFDWIQPNNQGNHGVAALGDGKGLLGSLLFSPKDMRFHSIKTPEGPVPAGMKQTDSLGRIHAVSQSGADGIYRMSADGGRTWTEDLVLPGIRPGDFRANAAAGVAAVSGVEGTQDVLYKLDISGDEPKVLRRYLVGKGDDCRCSGVGFYGLEGGHRFDFHSVVILPDGRLAVSFMDSENITKFPTLGVEVVAPALAVELDTTLPEADADGASETPTVVEQS